MKAATWLRVLAGVMAFFTAGHTMGMLSPPPNEAARVVVETMQRAHFPIMGFERSYWDFYRGMGFFLSVFLATIGVLAWQLGALSRRSPGDALPLTFTLEAVCVVTVLFSWTYFFTAPIVTSLLALVCATGALVALLREARSA